MPMFNATRIAVVASIIALVGGLSYVAVPTVERAISPAAPAAIDPADFAGFTGTFRATGSTAGKVANHDWGSTTDGAYYAPMELEVSDDRLSGTARATHNAIRFVGGATHGVRTLRAEIVNDGGTWEGTGIAFHDPNDKTMRYELLLSGGGDYAGLSALLSLASDTALIQHEAQGVIFPGELPPYPVLEDVQVPAEWTGEIDPGGYAGVTGTMKAKQGTWGERHLTDWGMTVRGNHYEGIELELDDPRLAGEQEALINFDTWLPSGPQWGVRTTASRIVNDAGSWVSTTSFGYQDPDTTGLHYVNVYRGTGDYAGLSALTIASQDSFGFSFDTRGVIFPGELPPYPELPPAE